MPIRQITIIGTGLIGGSFALALKKHRFNGRIVGCDSAGVLDRAKNRLAIMKELQILPTLCAVAT